ncbi:MAG: PA2779 family protein [Betaproteobacteria bacterium]|nr:PA2779 family protein [Betaproteobacteria bacterium]
MNVKLSHRLGGLVVGVALCLQASAVLAEIVTTNEMAAQNQADSERAKVQSFLERTDVKGRLLALGVKGLVAKDRVAALSDQEVHTLAQKIDSMPAGGNLGSMNNSDLTVILLLLILVAVLA